MPGRRVVIVATLAGGAVLEDAADVGLTLAAAASWRRAGEGEGAVDAAGGAENAPSEVSPARVRADVSPEGVTLRIAIEPARLAEALTALASMVSEPRVDEARMAAWRARLKALESRERNPERLVARALMDLLVPDGVPGDGQLPPIDRLIRLEAERVRAWLETKVAAAPMEVAIAGPIELKPTEVVVAKVFGPLADRARVDDRTYVDRRQAKRAPGPINEEAVLQIPAGTVHLMAGFTGPDVGMLTDVRALNVALSIARSRLEALREDKRLDAELVGARVMPARQHPGLGAAIVTAKVRDAGDAAERTMLALHQVLHELMSAGPTAEEVTRATEKIATDARSDAADPEYWAGVLAIANLQGIDIDSLADAADVYGKLTAENVRETLRRWCVDENRFSLVARGRE